jgi:hypothetical protein
MAAASGPQVAPGSQPIALGTPGAVPVAPFQQTNGQPAANQGQGRTLIGQPAPTGLPNYAQGYPHAPYPGQVGDSGQPGPPGQNPMPPGSMPPFGQRPGPGQPHVPPLGPHGQTMMPQQGPQGQMPPQQMPQGQMPQGQMPPQQGPGQPMMHPGPQGQPMMPQLGPHGQTMMPMQMHAPPPGYPGAPYSTAPQPPYGANPQYGPPNQPYGASNQFNAGVSPIEQVVHPEGKKRSSIARDVAIGVAIAALVLGAFLAVKFLILDRSGGTAEATAPAPTFATVKPMLPGGEANLFVDDKKIATARDKQEFQVSPGPRTLKLVTANGVTCEQKATLVAGKTFILDCASGAAAPGPGSAATGLPPAGDGSAAPSPGSGSTSNGTASAGSTAGSGSSAGSAVAAGPGASGGTTRTGAVDHPVPDKTDRMPVEDKPKTETTDHPKVAQKTTEKAVEKAVEKAPSKPIDKPADRSTDKPADRPRATERPSKSAAIEDDLGTLQGGVKPGDKKPMDARTGDAKGYLTAITRPVSQVFVDGNDTGLTTPINGHALSLAPGKHKVVFVYAGGKLQQWITVKPGETVALNKDLR